MALRPWILVALLLLPALSEPLSLLQRAQKVFKPLPARMDGQLSAPSPALIDLGRRLFYEKQLSQNNTMSCNSCHDLRYGYGADGRVVSPGAVSGRGTRNAPSVYHAALHASQFWDGRSPTVEDQARFPMLEKVEMAMPSLDEVESRLRSSSEYVRRFAEAYPGQKQPVTWKNAMLAIGAFERGLVTPGPFDRYLQGDESALDSSQLKGLEHFLRLGCAECHDGAALGGNQLRRLGARESFLSEDRGRIQATHLQSDDGVFKVPSLRNVCETAPYYHNGRVARLEEAVSLMGRHECGKRLSPQEVSELCDFLTSLTGQVPKDYVSAP